jgi:hypothetical protein
MPTDVVPIPGVGDVEVRGLTRWEAMHVQNMKNQIQKEIKTISLAMLDPAMTEADVAAWMKAGGAGEFEDLSQKIKELSGTGEKADSKEYERFEDDPGSEFRALPSGEAGDDGEPTPTGDVEP